MKKFDDPSKLKDSIDVSLKRMGRVLFMPVTSAMRTARMFTQPSSIARKASNDVMGEIKKLKEPPSSLAEYVDGGSHYIARRLLYLLILAALILPALFINFAWPVLQSRFFTRTMPVDSAVAASYTGKVSRTVGPCFLREVWIRAGLTALAACMVMMENAGMKEIS